MTTLARRNSSIHKVREYQLDKVDLEEEYEVVHLLQEGWRGRILLVEHRRTHKEVILKAMHREATTRLDFFREFHYNYYLSPHKNILNAYDVAFLAGDYFIFAQEYAPFGDVTSNMTEVGLGEINTKRVALQLASALDFMHSKELVHRDITMDNILIFKLDFSSIKLCDFGSTRKSGTLMKKKTVWLPYAPPEIVDAVQNEGFHIEPAQDVWQLGVLIYVLLTGSLPWMKADLTDPNYVEYINWRKRRILRTPKRFVNFTSRLLRMFKRLLEPKPSKRCSVKEVYKYLEDKWLYKLPKRPDADDNQSICYSTYSIHSSKIEKDKILRSLKEHGLETTVDRVAKKTRMNEWLERSVSTKNNLDYNDLVQKDEPILDDAEANEEKPKKGSDDTTSISISVPPPISENRKREYSSSSMATRQISDSTTKGISFGDGERQFNKQPVAHRISVHREHSRDRGRVVLSVSNVRRGSQETVMDTRETRSRSMTRATTCSPHLNRKSTPQLPRRAQAITSAAIQAPISPTWSENSHTSRTHGSPSRIHFKFNATQTHSSPTRGNHSPIRAHHSHVNVHPPVTNHANPIQLQVIPVRIPIVTTRESITSSKPQPDPAEENNGNIYVQSQTNGNQPNLIQSSSHRDTVHINMPGQIPTKEIINLMQSQPSSIREVINPKIKRSGEPPKRFRAGLQRSKTDSYLVTIPQSTTIGHQTSEGSETPSDENSISSVLTVAPR